MVEVFIKLDYLAGNYIFIADETGDQYANATLTVEANEVEVVVLMHKMGRSIGIMNVEWSGNVYTGFTLWKIYDPDATLVMSYLNPDN